VARGSHDALAPTVAAALEQPWAGSPIAIDVAGTRWAGLAWGANSAPPLVLVHGVASSAATFGRIGPALAAAGRHVIAVDLPGHGGTRPWFGRHRLDSTARVLGGFIRAVTTDRADAAVVAHSWGAMVAAWLPAAGISPNPLVLIDPPAMTQAALEAMSHDATERRHEDIREARTAVTTANPGWSSGDVEAKASALCQLDSAAVRAVLTCNGDWDAGLAAVAHRRARDLSVWVIRGDPGAGGLIPDTAAAALGEVIGHDHLVTIAGCGHSPHRTHPATTVATVLAALSA
jgi:pimeloyl-ACP methyl ester carboxylesterase